MQRLHRITKRTRTLRIRSTSVAGMSTLYPATTQQRRGVARRQEQPPQLTFPLESFEDIFTPASSKEAPAHCRIESTVADRSIAQTANDRCKGDGVRKGAEFIQLLSDSRGRAESRRSTVKETEMVRK